MSYIKEECLKLIKEPLYKDQELNDLSNNPSGYTIRVYKLNKKSVSCKIAKGGNFEHGTKMQNVKILNDKLYFRNYFKSFPVSDLEAKYV
jgi:hypothetical protein